MAKAIIMPRQGQSVETCIITKWHKKKGDQVKQGDFLFTYETDKSTFDEEAQDEGILLDIFFEEGDEVPVLTNVCVIGEEEENIDEFRVVLDEDAQEQEDEEQVEVKDEPEEILSNEKANFPIVNDIQEIKISPRARNLALRKSLDYRYANPTGPDGRIIERDIYALAENGPIISSAAREEFLTMDVNSNIAGKGLGGRVTTDDLDRPSISTETNNIEQQPLYEEVKLTSIRKVIAKAMHNSLSTTAQLTLNASFDATDILNYRKKIKAYREELELENITLNDIVLYAVSRILLKHRELNANLVDDKMRFFNNVQLGVAVDTPRGLMVPTIFNANLKSLNQIAAESKKLIDDCQKGTISPDNLKGGSFTVTNLGTLDIESFTPVLNPPQTGILGVDNIVQRAKELDGEIVFYPAMGLSLTFDHRAIDGAPAGKFLKELKMNLENFSILLAK